MTHAMSINMTLRSLKVTGNSVGDRDKGANNFIHVLYIQLAFKAVMFLTGATQGVWGSLES